MPNTLMDAHRLNESLVHHKPRDFPHENPVSVSQTSSFDDSMPSQLSETQISAQEGLISSRGFASKVALTPATSFSNASSQEQATSPNYPSDTRVDTHNAVKPHATAASALAIDASSQPSPERSPRNAPKRMANGELKSPVAGLPMSPAEPTEARDFAHSRNSSMNSRNSQITEMSHQLKTRLSYAMIKVQNGWQDQSLSELENLASQQGSPISAASDKRRPFQFSPTGEAQFPRSSGRPLGSKPDQHFLTSPRKRVSSQEQYAQTSENPLSSASSSQASTYEAFWREHSNTNTSRLPLSQTQHPAGPSLAPPVDIQPRTHWQQGLSAARQPPPLQIGSHPSTPQKRPNTATRTPSQQAAVEKDAVETLLFMSSPGNSGYHPHTSTQPSTSARTPLTASVLPDRQPSVQGHSRSRPVMASTTSKQQSSTAPRPGRAPLAALSERDMDRVLDQMSDPSSDDDD